MAISANKATHDFASAVNYVLKSYTSINVTYSSATKYVENDLNNWIIVLMVFTKWYIF